MMEVASKLPIERAERIAKVSCQGVGRGSLGFQLTNGQPDQTLVITY